MSAHVQRVLGWVAVVVFTASALWLLATGLIFDGWDPPGIQCLRGDVPQSGGPFYETAIVTGQQTLFPLGIDCTYDVPGDDFGPQTVHHYNVGTTIALVVSGLGVVGGGLLVYRASVLDRVRGL